MDSQATIAAGMLEAEGTSPDAPAADQAATLAEIEAGPTLWMRTKWIQNLNEYRQRVNRRVACWRAPTLAFPDTPEILAFYTATNYQDLRFEVASLADWTALKAQQRPNCAVSAYVRRRARADWRWRWPLRMGVLASPFAARLVTEARGSGHFSRLYSVFETDSSADCEILFVTPDAIGQSFRKAAIVVVVGVTPADLPADSLGALLRLGSAGVVLCPDDSLAWVENLVVELSHDSPLDLALAKAVPNAVLIADDGFVARTTVRQWGMELSAALRASGNEVAAVALERTLRGRFDQESGEATDVTTVSEVARTTGIDAAVRGSPPRMAAVPPIPEPPAAEPPVALPDERRLQAIVRCAAGPGAKTKVTDRFVPGAGHNIRVRIAAERIAGAVIADGRFSSPLPGQSVKLEVSIIVDGARTRRTLTLPAVADSKWTTAVPFNVPAATADFAVYIEVAYKRRVIQSASLRSTPFALSIDVSEPTAAVSVRTGAKQRITVVDGPRGDPTVVDLDDDAGDVGESQIDQATKALRRELLAAFLNPPSSLKEAAGPLTRLAVRGRILYERLAGGADTYHDDDEWIHVNAFSKRDVPIELAYTHPMPSSDTLVPVCPEGLAGATGCGKNCSHRNDAGVVCPFGFWATSKIIERRRHVDGRSNTTSGVQRQVSPTRSSVVGVSVKADEADTTSSARIIKALVQSVVSATTAESWKELEDAAATHPRLLVLVTHTVEPQDGDDLGTSLELNGDVRPIHRIDAAAINPGRQQPGPVVLALGCDTNTLTAGYTDLVVNLHNARAEVVLSALSPIPGKGVADFLERFMPLLKAHIGAAGPHRFGAVMLAARRETIACGDLMALALSATGDADVELTT